jgi:hypothetical protein
MLGPLWSGRTKGHGGCRHGGNVALLERFTNGDFPPGHFPGLYAAKCRVSPCFVRFWCPEPNPSNSEKPNVFNDIISRSARIHAIAPKLWKLGCTSASGASASTIMAATASVRNVTARRSTMTAISTTAVMKNDRCVATSDRTAADKTEQQPAPRPPPIS